MLSDPLAITYNSVGKNLAVASGSLPGVKKVIATRAYRDSTGEFEAFTSCSQLPGNMNRSMIMLSRVQLDSDSDPFNAGSWYYPNRVGLVFDTSETRTNTSVDVPLLRTALLALVDTTLQGRLIAGEI